MPSAVEVTAPREARLVEVAPAPLLPRSVRVRTYVSGLSAGTELTAYRGTNPYLTQHWDPELRRFRPGASSFAYPLLAWGYSEVGEVVEVSDDAPAGSPAPGAIVWGAWGHRSDAVVPLDRASPRVVPHGVDPVAASFARVGAIALNAVLAAELSLGELVVVFGQGVIGLLATRLAGLSGADVVAVDQLDQRLAVAASLGARTVRADDPRGVAEAVDALLGDARRAPDACIELSGSTRALHEAIRTAGQDGTVVAAGFYQGDAVGLRLGDEFHHNRVRLVASQIGAVPPALRDRWDVLRMEQTVVRLVQQHKIDTAPLVSHLVPASQVADAFEMLDERPADALQVVLDFRAEAP